MAVAVSLFTPAFMTGPNLAGILEQVAVISIVALAVNQVILAGEIDVSTGSLLAVCAFIYGNVALALGGAWLPLAASLIIGGTVGLINGLLSTVARIPSIIATLGMLFVLRGGVLLLAVRRSSISRRSPHFRPRQRSRLACLHRHRAGRLRAHGTAQPAFALGARCHGDRRQSPRGEGARPADHLRPHQGLCRLGSRLRPSAAVFLGQIGQLQATAATGFELKVIAAVVLGGTSIKGGYGSNAAPVIGAVLVGMILNALTLNRVPGTFELLVLCALILAAVSFDGLKRLIAGERE